MKATTPGIPKAAARLVNSELGRNAAAVAPMLGPEGAAAAAALDIAAAREARAAHEAEARRAEHEAEAAMRDYDRKGGSGGRSGVRTSVWGWMLFLFAVLHLLDGLFLNFRREAGITTVLCMLGVTFAILVPLIRGARLVDEGQWLPNFITYLLLNALVIFLPYAIGFLSDKMPKLTMLWFLYFLMNPWMVWLMFKAPEETMPAYILKWWILFWVFVLLVSLFATTTFQVPGGRMKTDIQLGWRDFSNHLSDSVSATWEKILLGKKRFQQSINGSLDAYYYTGKVETNSDRQLGVVIDKAEPSFPGGIFDPTQTPSIYAYVSAESFLQDTMFVVPGCRISRDSKRQPVAQIEPQMLEIYKGHSELFECKFPKDGVKWEEGSYPVEVTATFDFETWADIPYYFVKEQTSRSYARLEKDINAELDIPIEPQATYTNGPIKIGMGGSRMPLLVTDEPPYIKNAYLGFTVSSAWLNGELKRVDTLELKVPKGFVLTECDRREGDVIEAQTDPNVPTYDRYIFTNVIDKDLPYTSVRCKLGITDPATLAELQASDKATRTFIATTSYQYTIKSKTEFRVQE